MQAMPDLKPLASVQAVVEEHLDALNRGDWMRLMAQYPDDVEIFLPGGLVIRGRRQVGEAFEGMVQPFDKGGLGGVAFSPEHTIVLGDTISVQWKAEAPFLREPYRGADAYIVRQGLLAAQVSTFDMNALRALRRG